MSFGFPEPVPELTSAIDYAYRNKVLMLAAASNCGGNDRPSWPSRNAQVMCIHATTGEGNRYPKDPTPIKDKANFAVLGSSVKALWLPDPTGKEQWVHKSGTSTATPIAAGIAGVIMSLLRRNETGYIERLPQREAAKEQERKRYERKLQALGRPDGMAEVFRLMVLGKRDELDYMAPWTLFHQSYKTETYMTETILKAIDA